MSFIETAMTISNSVLSKLLLSSLIIMSGFILGRMLGKLVSIFLLELKVNGIFLALTSISLNIEEIAGFLVSFFFYAASIILALNTMGIGSISFALAGAIFLILALYSIAISIRDFIPNFIAGISINKIAKIGDSLEIVGSRGKIIHFGLIEVKIKTIHNEELYIPNSLFLKQPAIITKKIKSSLKG